MGSFLKTVSIFLILAPAIFLQAAEATGLSLISDSPFLPPGFEPPGSGSPIGGPPPITSSEYEFHGVYQLGGVYYYNLFNLRERKGSWVSERKPLEDVRIISFDPADNLLVVNVGGEQSNLSLIQTSDRPMPVQTAPRARVTTANNKSTEAEARQPVRRRVIRPSVRTSTNASAAAAARRRVINRSNSNP